MRTRIIAALVGLGMVAGTALPAPLALAAPADRAGVTATAPPVIQAGERDRDWRDRRYRGRDGDRRWRGGDRQRWERRGHRRENYRDHRRSERWRADRRHDRRHVYRHDRRDDRGHVYRHDRRRDYRHDRRYKRRHDRRHYHDHDHDYDAAPFILGGIALGTLLLLEILDNDYDRDRGYRY